MNIKGKDIYIKFNSEDMEVEIPKLILFDVARQVNKYIEFLQKEKKSKENFAIGDNINKAENIFAKILIVSGEPYGRQEVILYLTIAEFLIFRYIVFCNHTIVYFKSIFNIYHTEKFKELFQQIEGLYGNLSRSEVREYWNYIKKN
ncbi:hypothetical protein [Xylanivirga thermophila]|uniref:hypothetical protein n=1 Tax=Xylanivirga thermophila TaxID=2496273 RepID=UPI00101D1DA8|nr:hypothetical protein [Xylanivirga thermophila]